MNYMELQARFEELENLNQVTEINQDVLEEMLEGLEVLRDDFMLNYFEFEKMEDYEELENIKIKITENILLCKISRDDISGGSNKKLEKELDNFYDSNGRVY